MKPLKIGVIGVPYNVSSAGAGTDKGPESLRAARLVGKLRDLGSEVADFGNLEVKLPSGEKSNAKLLNPNQVVTICKSLAARIQDILGSGYFPLILGGDDSILMGTVEGFRRVLGSRIGLIYMDAHGDFNTPETTPSGIIGGMDVAIAVGRGSEELVEMFGHSPLLPEEHVVLYGTRDLDKEEAAALAASEIRVYTRQKIRKHGVDNVIKRILGDLEKRCDYIYLHVDLDVLDEAAMSAQALPVSDGLSESEFEKTLQSLVQSKKLCGIAIMMFDAAKDADGKEARKVVKLVTAALDV